MNTPEFREDFLSEEVDNKTLGVIRLDLKMRNPTPSLFLGDAETLAIVREAIRQEIYLGELEGKHSHTTMKGATVQVSTDPNLVNAFKMLADLGFRSFGPTDPGDIFGRMEDE